MPKKWGPHIFSQGEKVYPVAPKGNTPWQIRTRLLGLNVPGLLTNLMELCPEGQLVKSSFMMGIEPIPQITSSCHLRGGFNLELGDCY